MDTNEKRKFLIKISVLVLILLILVLVFTLLIKKQKENKTEISESTSESAFTFSNASTTFSSLFSNAVPETAETSETEPETTAPTLIVTGTTVPETSETEPETVEETSTEETSQDDETLWDTEAGIADTEEETQADETKETIKETEPETTQEETVSERKFDKYTNVVIIGDSRTVQMAKAMNAETVEEHQNPNYGGVFRNGKYIFVCENSAGAEWLDSTGFTEAKPYIRATTAVVFWLGVNDTGNSSDAISASVNNYISLIQEQLDNVECDIFYVSVGPCTGKWEYWNLYTEEFNRDMKKRLKNTTWIEVYDMLTAGLSAGDYQTDSSGVHYSVNAYKDVFYMIYYKTPVDSTELSPGDSALGGIGYTTG